MTDGRDRQDFGRVATRRYDKLSDRIKRSTGDPRTVWFRMVGGNS